MRKFKLIFKKNLTLMALLIFVIFLSIFIVNFLEEKISSQQSLIGGSFELIDEDSKLYKSKKIKKKKLIYFGYTFCPDVCPFDLIKLSKFLDQNPEMEKNVQAIFISVDPQRDTPKTINSFLENFNPSIKGLTGTQEQIKDLTKKFGVYYRYNKVEENDKDYLIDHSSFFFLLEKNDKYITHFHPQDFNSLVFKYLN